MLKELIGYYNGIRNTQEEMKFILSEIKKNLQGTNSEGKEARIQINDLEHKEEINIQPEKKQEIRIQKNKDSIRRLWDISKYANTRIIRMPEREEEEQETENLFEKIMKENFPIWQRKQIIQVQKAQRVPNKLNPKRTTPRHVIIKMLNIKDKERILKAAREKQIVTHKGVPIRLEDDFSKKLCRLERTGKENSK